MSMCLYEVLHLYDIFHYMDFAMMYMHYTLLDMQICHMAHLCKVHMLAKANRDNSEPLTRIQF